MRDAYTFCTSLLLFLFRLISYFGQYFLLLFFFISLERFLLIQGPWLWFSKGLEDEIKRWDYEVFRICDNTQFNVVLLIFSKIAKGFVGLFN